MSRFRRFFLYLLPVLIWMLFIFGWSTDVGSTEHTRSFLEKFLSDLPFLSHLSYEQILAIDHVIRKGAHVTEYAIFAVLLFRALRQDRGDLRAVYLWGPVLIGLLYASTDEFHQTFVASRGASVFDVMFDTLGAIIGTALCAIWMRLRNRRRS